MDISRFLPAILIPLAVGGVMALISRGSAREAEKYRDGEGITLRMPRAMEICGWVFMAIGLGFIVLCALTAKDAKIIGFMAAIFSLPVLGGLFLIMACRNWSIRLPRDADHFICRSYFGRTQTVYFRDCIGYKEPPTIGWPDVVAMVEDRRGQMKKKTIHIELYATNFDEWIPTLRAHGVEPLPQKAK